MKIHWGHLGNENGITLLELVIALGVSAPFVLGTAAVITTLARNQSALNVRGLVHARAVELRSFFRDKTACTLNLGSVTVDPASTAVIPITSISYVNKKTQALGATYLQAGMRLPESPLLSLAKATDSPPGLGLSMRGMISEDGNALNSTYSMDLTVAAVQYQQPGNPVGPPVGLPPGLSESFPLFVVVSNLTNQIVECTSDSEDVSTTSQNSFHCRNVTGSNTFDANSGTCTSPPPPPPPPCYTGTSHKASCPAGTTLNTCSYNGGSADAQWQANHYPSREFPGGVIQTYPVPLGGSSAIGNNQCKCSWAQSDPPGYAPAPGTVTPGLCAACCVSPTGN